MKRTIRERSENLMSKRSLTLLDKYDIKDLLTKKGGGLSLKPRLKFVFEMARRITPEAYMGRLAKSRAEGVSVKEYLLKEIWEQLKYLKPPDIVPHRYAEDDVADMTAEELQEYKKKREQLKEELIQLLNMGTLPISEDTLKEISKQFNPSYAITRATNKYEIIESILKKISQREEATDKHKLEADILPKLKPDSIEAIKKHKYGKEHLINILTRELELGISLNEKEINNFFKSITDAYLTSKDYKWVGPSTNIWRNLAESAEKSLNILDEGAKEHDFAYLSAGIIADRQQRYDALKKADKALVDVAESIIAKFEDEVVKRGGTKQQAQLMMDEEKKWFNLEFDENNKLASRAQKWIGNAIFRVISPKAYKVAQILNFFIGNEATPKDDEFTKLLNMAIDAQTVKEKIQTLPIAIVDTLFISSQTQLTEEEKQKKFELLKEKVKEAIPELYPELENLDPTSKDFQQTLKQIREKHLLKEGIIFAENKGDYITMPPKKYEAGELASKLLFDPNNYPSRAIKAVLEHPEAFAKVFNELDNILKNPKLYSVDEVQLAKIIDTHYGFMETIYNTNIPEELKPNYTIAKEQYELLQQLRAHKTPEELQQIAKNNAEVIGKLEQKVIDIIQRHRQNALIDGKPDQKYFTTIENEIIKYVYKNPEVENAIHPKEKPAESMAKKRGNVEIVQTRERPPVSAKPLHATKSKALIRDMASVLDSLRKPYDWAELEKLIQDNKRVFEHILRYSEDIDNDHKRLQFSSQEHQLLDWFKSNQGNLEFVALFKPITDKIDSEGGEKALPVAVPRDESKALVIHREHIPPELRKEEDEIIEVIRINPAMTPDEANRLVHNYPMPFLHIAGQLLDISRNPANFPRQEFIIADYIKRNESAFAEPLREILEEKVAEGKTESKRSALEDVPPVRDASASITQTTPVGAEKLFPQKYLTLTPEQWEEAKTLPIEKRAQKEIPLALPPIVAEREMRPFLMISNGEDVKLTQEQVLDNKRFYEHFKWIEDGSAYTDNQVKMPWESVLKKSKNKLYTAKKVNEQLRYSGYLYDGGQYVCHKPRPTEATIKHWSQPMIPEIQHPSFARMIPISQRVKKPLNGRGRPIEFFRDTSAVPFMRVYGKGTELEHPSIIVSKSGEVVRV